MKTKVEGISILIAMGTSLLVLSLAFATLNSISRSLDQASNIQRSTQLFFASESGAEAAFFHHNARGAGLEFATSTDASQSINHNAINATTNWSIAGRTLGLDSAPIAEANATLVDILKEGQTLKIPLRWDGSANPAEDPPQETPSQYDQPNSGTDDISISFYLDPDNINSSTALDLFNEKYNFGSDVYPIGGGSGFDFGDASLPHNILIDWSFTRKHSDLGVQTFIPSDNQDCSGFSTNPGYICENDFMGMGSGNLEIATNHSIQGKILPDPGLSGGGCLAPANGSNCTSLISFWQCSDFTIGVGETCSDYQFTVRALLEFNDTFSGEKIPGLPYQIQLENIGDPPKSFPQSTYTVTSDVVLEDFSQQITIEVPEKTSIGAFDYVIFD